MISNSAIEIVIRCDLDKAAKKYTSTEGLIMDNFETRDNIKNGNARVEMETRLGRLAVDFQPKEGINSSCTRSHWVSSFSDRL